MGFSHKSLKIQNLLYFIYFALIISFYGCSSSFIVEQTTLKKEIKNKDSRSNTISVTVNDVEKGVEFQKIVFNRIESDVMVKDLSNNSYEVTSVQKFMLDDESYKGNLVDKSNRLTYTLNGKEGFYQLNDITFLPTKVFIGS